MPGKRKIWLILAITIFLIPPIIAQEGLTVSVANLNNDRGHVLISLFRDCVGFPDKPQMAYRKTQVPIRNQTASCFFENLPAGNYSIAILHDENDDKKMNTNFFGIPKEGYGFANNVMGIFGPPTCNKASFKYAINSRLQMIILARYGW